MDIKIGWWDLIKVNNLQTTHVKFYLKMVTLLGTFHDKDAWVHLTRTHFTEFSQVLWKKWINLRNTSQLQILYYMCKRDRVEWTHTRLLWSAWPLISYSKYFKALTNKHILLHVWCPLPIRIYLLLVIIILHLPNSVSFSPNLLEINKQYFWFGCLFYACICGVEPWPIWLRCRQAQWSKIQ